MRFSFVTALLFIFSMGCAQSKSKPITEVSQNELNNVILVDVRTPEEHAAGHIENSLNINWNGDSFVKQFEAMDKDDMITCIVKWVVVVQKRKPCLILWVTKKWSI